MTTTTMTTTTKQIVGQRVTQNATPEFDVILPDKFPFEMATLPYKNEARYAPLLFKVLFLTIRHNFSPIIYNIILYKTLPIKKGLRNF